MIYCGSFLSLSSGFRRQNHRKAPFLARVRACCGINRKERRDAPTSFHMWNKWVKLLTAMRAIKKKKEKKPPDHRYVVISKTFPRYFVTCEDRWNGSFTAVDLCEPPTAGPGACYLWTTGLRLVWLLGNPDQQLIPDTWIENRTWLMRLLPFLIIFFFSAWDLITNLIVTLRQNKKDEMSFTSRQAPRPWGAHQRLRVCKAKQ